MSDRQNASPESAASPGDERARNELYEEFLERFVRDQFRVMGYIRMLIQDQGDAGDVFQETSLELWRSFPSFRRDEAFVPWAIGIARHQVLKYWRSRNRDRHVFSDDVLQSLASDAATLAQEIPLRQRALEECLKRITHRQSELVQKFYRERQSADAIAKSWNRSVHAVYKALSVLRRALFDCIETRLASEVPQSQHP